MVVRNRRIALRRYIVPLGAICCCFFFVRASSAKMINSSPVSKEGEVHVAEWSVDVNAVGNSNLVLDAGGNTQSYSLVVENNSEVVSTYSIKVSGVPAGIKIGLDIASDNDLVSPVGGEVTFTNTGGDLSYAAPNNARTHVLTLKAEPTANVTQNDVDLAIDVLFAQKDPRL